MFDRLKSVRAQTKTSGDCACSSLALVEILALLVGSLACVTLLMCCSSVMFPSTYGSCKRRSMLGRTNAHLVIIFNCQQYVWCRSDVADLRNIKLLSPLSNEGVLTAPLCEPVLACFYLKIACCPRVIHSPLSKRPTFCFSVVEFPGRRQLVFVLRTVFLSRLHSACVLATHAIGFCTAVCKVCFAHPGFIRRRSPRTSGFLRVVRSDPQRFHTLYV